jgi:hypothetical protein
MMAIDPPVAAALEHITSEYWSLLRSDSLTDCRWQQLEWWHNKYYRDNPPNDGFALQRPRKGEPELPYGRRLFYASGSSRFSLGAEGPVAFFSNDFAVNCCETIEQFSDDQSLSFQDLSRYLRGHGNPTPGWYGYPLNFHLVPSALILDVSVQGAPFFRMIERCAGSSLAAAVFRTITSREPDDKRNTQRISLESRRSGFDGLVYRSVRAPADIVLPDRNLVVFTTEAVVPGLPPYQTMQWTGV